MKGIGRRRQRRHLPNSPGGCAAALPLLRRLSLSTILAARIGMTVVEVAAEMAWQ